MRQVRMCVKDLEGGSKSSSETAEQLTIGVEPDRGGATLK